MNQYGWWAMCRIASSAWKCTEIFLCPNVSKCLSGYNEPTYIYYCLLWIDIQCGLRCTTRVKDKTQIRSEGDRIYSKMLTQTQTSALNERIALLSVSIPFQYLYMCIYVSLLCVEKFTTAILSDGNVLYAFGCVL